MIAAKATEELIDVKESEVLSYLIVRSPRFRAFVDQLNAQYDVGLNCELISNLILGRGTPKGKEYLGEILNGPFDADRIDYVVRDSDYSGVKAGIDLERFFHDLDIAPFHSGTEHLVLRSTHAIEQLLWAKVHFFIRVYRHQKVLAADGAVQQIPTVVAENANLLNGCDFSKVSDYLRVTDMDILGATLQGIGPQLHSRLLRLRQRQLPHRCLAITHQIVRRGGGSEGAIHKLQVLNETAGGVDKLRDEIWDAIPSSERPSHESIIAVFPRPPSLREATLTYILQRGLSEPQTLNSLFKIDAWLTTYVEQHWVGYIFADFDDVNSVGEAAISVLAGREIQVDSKLALALSRPPVLTAVPTIRPAAAPAELFLAPVPGLPVLETYVQKLKAAGKGPILGDLHAILILHFLTDLPPFLERLKTLGLDPNKTWLVRKPYQYKDADVVRKRLRDRGYRIEECTAAENPDEPAARVLDEVSRELGPSGRFFVIEDGGYVTPMLHEKMYANLLQKCIGVVEQTTKGLRSIEKVMPLLVPVIAVARSQLKTALEAAEVGDALAYTLEHFYRSARNTKLTLPVLVIGYGSIGASLAEGLALRGADVAIYDKDGIRRAKASTLKFPRLRVLDNLENLQGFKLVIGTTGVTSLLIESILKLSDGALLASGSSDRLEFDVAALKEHVAEPIDKNITLDGFVTSYRLKDGRTIGVLCDGYPINFVLGDGIAKSVIDPILTELAAGAMLFANGEVKGVGIHDLPKELEEEIWTMYESFGKS
jgi:S-adenosylhomocysteine hydrolase/HD superfamily phosphohydrolase